MKQVVPSTVSYLEMRCLQQLGVKLWKQCVRRFIRYAYPGATVDAMDHIYRPGFKYSKAEVMLLNLCQPGEYTDDLFAVSQPAEATRVMTVLDQINGRWGRGALRSASVPTNPDWGMRREMMSQSYTTRLDQLWSVACK